MQEVAAPVMEATPPPPEAPAPKVEAAPPAPEAPAAKVEVEAATSEAPPASEAAPESAVAADGTPKKKRKKRVTKKPPAPTRKGLDQKIDRLEAKLEEKKEEAAKAAREGFGSNPALDDTSVPPVDLEVHDDFFAAGESQPIAKDASGSFAGLDARHAQKMTAAAHARRAHLSRYVKWAVGGSAGLLMLAITVSKLRGHPNDEPVRHEITHATQAPVVTQPAEPAKVDPPPVIEVGDQGNMDDKKTGDNAVADDTKADAKVDEIVDTDKKPDEMPAEKPKNAWQEKQAAKAALERGSNGAAVAAGERAVALDPSDGEAWLVLGGAYQAMGNAGQAKRCYNACVSQGKKGPIGDCKDMLGSFVALGPRRASRRSVGPRTPSAPSSVDTSPSHR